MESALEYRVAMDVKHLLNFPETDAKKLSESVENVKSMLEALEAENSSGKSVFSRNGQSPTKGAGSWEKNVRTYLSLKIGERKLPSWMVKRGK